MINENNVKRFCCEDISRIENYDLAIKDMNKTWHCHHRLEVGANGEVVSREQLNRCGLYYNRPASELIFLTCLEHVRLHHRGKITSDETKRKIGEKAKGRKLSEEARIKMSKVRKGRKHSEETRRKIGEALSGKKRKSFSEEHKRKLSEAQKNMSAETKRKMSEAHKGKHFSEETRRKMSESLKAYWEKKRMTKE